MLSHKEQYDTEIKDKTPREEKNRSIILFLFWVTIALG